VRPVGLPRRTVLVIRPNIALEDTSLCYTFNIRRGVRCARFDQTLHSRMPLSFTPACLKLLHACDKEHSSRVFILLPVDIVNSVETRKAFNMTTGPPHWTLLQRARAVDNQLYVAAVSPARSSDKTAYQAWGHSSVVSPWVRMSPYNHELCHRTDDVTLIRMSPYNPPPPPHALHP
jgi:hypothetical protein